MSRCHHVEHWHCCTSCAALLCARLYIVGAASDRTYQTMPVLRQSVTLQISKVYHHLLPFPSSSSNLSSFQFTKGHIGRREEISSFSRSATSFESHPIPNNLLLLHPLPSHPYSPVITPFFLHRFPHISRRLVLLKLGICAHSMVQKALQAMLIGHPGQ